MKRRSVLIAGGAGAISLAAPMLSRRAYADTLDDVKKRGEIVIGMEVAYVPYEFFKDGQIVGYDPDLCQIFADKLGVKLKMVDTEWAGIIPALYAKKFDAIISGMTITKARAEKVLFSMPYANASSVIFVLQASPIQKADDLAGKRVGVQLGSAAANLVTEWEAKMKAKGLAGYAEVKQYEHYPEAYQDLINKRLDAVVNSLSTLLVVMKDKPGTFRTVAGIQDIDAYFGMAFRQGDEGLRDFVNTQLASLKSSGELSKMQMKWFGQTMDTPNTVPTTLP
jgi:polar amino acid transport system substrate-binding protein